MESIVPILMSLLPLLEAMPQLVADVKAFIAAWESGGTKGAQEFLAGKMANDTSALEQELQTPISGAKS